MFQLKGVISDFYKMSLLKRREIHNYKSFFLLLKYIGLMILFIRLSLTKEVEEKLNSSLIQLVYTSIVIITFISCDYQVTIEANGMSIKCPHQLMINGDFVNSSWGRTYDTINPSNEKVCILYILYINVI